MDQDFDMPEGKYMLGLKKGHCVYKATVQGYEEDKTAKATNPFGVDDDMFLGFSWHN